MVNNEAQQEQMDAVELYLLERRKLKLDKKSLKNKQDYEKKRKRAERRNHHLSLYKTAKGCHNCGYKDHSVALYFFHVNNNRNVGIASALFNCTLKKLFKEIRKTKLTCANCTAIFTAQRRKEYHNV
jgi:hypothetical protein